MNIIVVQPQHELRSYVERFIADVYRDHYRASLSSFPPDLIAMIEEGGKCICASGLRYDHTGFFSERYLDIPIEQALSQAAGTPVARGWHQLNSFAMSWHTASAPVSIGHFSQQRGGCASSSTASACDLWRSRQRIRPG